MKQNEALLSNESPESIGDILQLPPVRQKREPFHDTEARKGEPVTAETLAANFRHDRYYGWSIEHPRSYTNVSRFPEYEQAWRKEESD